MRTGLRRWNSTSTHNTSGDVGVGNSPSQSQRSHRSTNLLGKFGELLDLLNLGFTLLSLEGLDLTLEEGLVGVESGSVGHTVVVFPGKETRVQRRPDGAIMGENGSYLGMTRLTFPYPRT